LAHFYASESLSVTVNKKELTMCILLMTDSLSLTFKNFFYLPVFGYTLNFYITIFYMITQTPITVTLPSLQNNNNIMPPTVKLPTMEQLPVSPNIIKDRAQINAHSMTQLLNTNDNAKQLDIIGDNYLNNKLLDLDTNRTNLVSTTPTKGVNLANETRQFNNNINENDRAHNIESLYSGGGNQENVKKLFGNEESLLNNNNALAKQMEQANDAINSRRAELLKEAEAAQKRQDYLNSLTAKEEVSAEALYFEKLSLEEVEKEKEKAAKEAEKAAKKAAKAAEDAKVVRVSVSQFKYDNPVVKASSLFDTDWSDSDSVKSTFETLGKQALGAAGLSDEFNRLSQNGWFSAEGQQEYWNKVGQQFEDAADPITDLNWKDYDELVDQLDWSDLDAISDLTGKKLSTNIIDNNINQHMPSITLPTITTVQPIQVQPIEVGNVVIDNESDKKESNNATPLSSPSITEQKVKVDVQPVETVEDNTIAYRQPRLLNAVEPQIITTTTDKNFDIVPFKELNHMDNSQSITEKLKHYYRGRKSKAIARMIQSHADYLTHMFDVFFVVYANNKYMDLFTYLEENATNVDGKKYYKNSDVETVMEGQSYKNILAVRVNSIELPEMESETWDLKFLDDVITKIRSKVEFERKSTISIDLDERFYVLDLINAMSGNSIRDGSLNKTSISFPKMINTNLRDKSLRFDIIVKHRDLLKSNRKLPFLDKESGNTRYGLRKTIWDSYDGSLQAIVGMQDENEPYWVFEDVKFLGPNGDLQFDNNASDRQTIDYGFIFKRCYKVKLEDVYNDEDFEIGPLVSNVNKEIALMPTLL
jgi:hypothetical protein